MIDQLYFLSFNNTKYFSMSNGIIMHIGVQIQIQY